MDAYLSNPFSMKILRDTLQEWLPKVPDDPAPAAAGPNRSGSVTELLEVEVLDRVRALQQPGQPSLLDRVIGLYLESAPNLFDGIRAALSERDAQALSDRAHSLKSSSANLGAGGLAGLCKALEDAARQDRLEDATDLWKPMQAVFPATLSALTNQLDNMA